MRLPKVVVDGDTLTDAALIHMDEGPDLLVLRPFQTFTNAVQRVSALLPGLHPDMVRSLVRVNLPDALDFDEVSSPIPAAPRRCPELPKPPRTLVWGKRFLTHMAFASVVTLSVAGYLVSREGNEVADPFSSAAFKHFAKVGDMQCRPMDELEARCTDVDGLVMISSVVVAPGSTMFQFTYGTQRVILRVFANEEDAQTWKREPSASEMAPNLVLIGRYALYGTDKQRIKVYADLLRRTHNSSAASALPPRLASLTLGSLNLPDDPNLNNVSDPQLLAVKFVMGDPLPNNDADTTTLDRAYPHNPATPTTLPTSLMRPRKQPPAQAPEDQDPQPTPRTTSDPASTTADVDPTPTPTATESSETRTPESTPSTTASPDPSPSDTSSPSPSRTEATPSPSSSTQDTQGSNAQGDQGNQPTGQPTSAPASPPADPPATAQPDPSPSPVATLLDSLGL